MMHALKTPSFLRPTSRPNSPAPTIPPPSRPDSGVGFDRVARPLNRLSLSTFRRPSSAPSSVSTPTPVPLVQDGSYLEVLSLRLSEAVSKAFSQPTGPATANEQLAGKRPIPAGRGRALGALITSELNASKEKPHLHRAIIRSLHRPLSVLITNLSAHLLPLLSSPAFLSPSAPTQQSPNLNTTQLHAIALGTFAGEVLETFDELGLGFESDMRGDGLKVIREGLVSLASRVFNPLITGIRSELMPLLEGLETPNLVGSNSPKNAAGTKVSAIPHPSIVVLQNVMPIYAKALARYTTTSVTQTTLATFLISVVWRGLVALSHRETPPPTPPASPALMSALLKKNRRVSSSAIPSTPPARFAIKLPPSRPPSPPSIQVPTTAAADAHALYDLLNFFPRPVAGAEQETTRLAREAVDEAFDGLKALAVLLEAVQDTGDKEVQGTLEALTADLPTLVALPVLLRSYCPAGSECNQACRSVAAILGFPEEEYRKGCLAGYGRAEECATAVGQRVLDVLQGDGAASIVEKWLEHEITADADH